MHPNIHQKQPVLKFGTELEDAEHVLILLHGRGATAESMVPLAQALNPGGFHIMVPQAYMNRWYPNSAFGPLEANEPDLSSALETIDQLVNEAEQKGILSQKIVLGGFSQGACLAAEYAARNARKYGGLFVFSGALIGPEGLQRNYQGSFDGMPVFIGGSDTDPWVSQDLMVEAAGVFEKMGAEVDFRTYPGMAHTVNEDELNQVRLMLQSSSNGYA